MGVPADVAETLSYQEAVHGPEVVRSVLHLCLTTLTLSRFRTRLLTPLLERALNIPPRQRNPTNMGLQYHNLQSAPNTRYLPAWTLLPNPQLMETQLRTAFPPLIIRFMLTTLI